MATGNGGANTVWTNITGNIGCASKRTPVRSRVRPRQSGPQEPAALTGRLYVATNVGVYVSVNGGTTWKILGVGLPHVPVIDLQFNSTLQELVAGTQGRGVFQISTDVTGPHVVSVTPATPLNPLVTPLTSVTITFNTAIGSFPASQVTITGPNGQIIKEIGSPTNVSTVVPGFPNPENMWQITFAAQTAAGDYTFKIGPNVLDLVGNPMDQNQNGVNGENPGDVFTFQVALNSTEDGDFITGLYNDELGRPADTNGFIGNLAPVDAALNGLLPAYALSYIEGVGRPQLIQDLYASGSASSILGVGDLIQRAANPAEVNLLLGQLQSGISYEQLIASLTSSSTYFTESRVNGNDANFLVNVYNDLLHRNPDAVQENTVLLPQLSNAEMNSRFQDSLALLAGQAYHEEPPSSSSAYEEFMMRPAQSGDVTFGLNLFASGGTQEQLIAAILGSNEFYTSVAPSVVGQPASNATLITAMYDLLFPGYTVSGSEVSHFTSLINNNSYTGGPNPKGLSGEQIANILATSPLYRFGQNGPLPTTGAAPVTAANGLVDREYEAILGRHATLAELNHWQAVYAAIPNFSTSDLIATLLSSPEYFADNTTANTPLSSQDQQWAQALYSTVLGAGQGTTAANLNAEQTRDLPFLANAEMNARMGVSNAILGSLEFRDDVVTAIYKTDFNRNPNAFELNLFAPDIGLGGAPGGANGDDQVLDAVFSSQEFYLDQTPVNNVHTNGAWFNGLYNGLHVPVNATQEAVNLASLDAAYAGVRSATIQAFQASQEYITHLTVQAYNLYLGRELSPRQARLVSGSVCSRMARRRRSRSR